MFELCTVQDELEELHSPKTTRETRESRASENIQRRESIEFDGT